MPESFAPPQPKQWLAGLGSRMSLAHIMFKFFSRFSSHNSLEFASNQRAPHPNDRREIPRFARNDEEDEPRLTQKPFQAGSTNRSDQSHASYQSHPTAFGAADTALAFAHLDAQKISERGGAAHQFFFVQVREAEAQRVWQMRLHVKVSAGGEEQAALFGVDQKFAGVEAKR